MQISKPENTVQFQIDTGSQCDILPASLYTQVTGDKLLHRLKKCNKEIVSYTGERRRITSKVKLPIWFKGQRRFLQFNIIDGDYQSILSLDTSIQNRPHQQKRPRQQTLSKSMPTFLKACGRYQEPTRLSFMTQ